MLLESTMSTVSTISLGDDSLARLAVSWALLQAFLQLLLENASNKLQAFGQRLSRAIGCCKDIDVGKYGRLRENMAVVCCCIILL